MANDEEWIQDVKRWYRTGSALMGSEPGDSGDDDVAIGYEAAHPPLQARHWPDTASTTDR
jgi:hypothetical protein